MFTTENEIIRSSWRQIYRLLVTQSGTILKKIIDRNISIFLTGTTFRCPKCRSTSPKVVCLIWRNVTIICMFLRTFLWLIIAGWNPFLFMMVSRSSTPRLFTFLIRYISIYYVNYFYGGGKLKIVSKNVHKFSKISILKEGIQ